MIEGYAIKTADLGLDPVEWTIVANITDGPGNHQNILA